MSTLDDAIRAVKGLLADWSAQLPQSHTCNAHDWVEQKAIVALRDTILPALESVSKDKTAEVLRVAQEMFHAYRSAITQFEALHAGLANQLLITGYSVTDHRDFLDKYIEQFQAIQKERA